MKKIIKIAMAVAAVCMVTVLMAVTAFAEVKDVELSVTRATMCPAWGQSVTYTSADFNFPSFTEATEILIEYETDGGAMPDNGYHPAELILQNYTSDPQIWCQVAPYEFDETTAKFKLPDVVSAYTDLGGKEDLSDVNNVCIGATFVGVKVTKITVTNVEAAEAVTTTTTAATEAVTEAATEAATEAETTAATTSAPSAEKESSGGIPIVLIVVIAVVIAVAVVVTIIILKNKKRFY